VFSKFDCTANVLLPPLMVPSRIIADLLTFVKPYVIMRPMERWLTYDQISLIPTRVSTLEHRAEADTSVQFGPVKLKVPIIAAPMPDVCGDAMTRRLRELGSLGIMHRFQGIEDRIHTSEWGSAQAIAVSLKDYEVDVKAVRDHEMHSIICLDTANGASEMVHRALGTLKDKYPDIFIVTGNVASRETFQKLEDWGADAIRVGIAGGSVCETRTETGVYSPMATVVYQCAHIPQDIETWKPRKALLIADGGIKDPAHLCKALALGADVVMMGGALAGTDESPGPIIRTEDGKLKKRLAGAASYITQKESTGKKPTYVEGAETLVEYRGPVADVIDRFAAGLRSSMSYMNARTLTEYKRNVRIVEVS